MSTLSPIERTSLLQLARAAVVARVRGEDLPAPLNTRGALAQPGAAFVSVHRGDELRGCLGCIEPRHGTLAETVVHMAAAAASDDPRFAPLAADELETATIEVSVLGPLVEIRGPEEVVPGRDGLVVEHAGARGLLLPQVAAARAWDGRTFLEETCRKAGLSRSAWREGARLFRFEAQVFREATRGAARVAVE